jgi:hypothetical protein
VLNLSLVHKIADKTEVQIDLKLELCGLVKFFNSNFAKSFHSVYLCFTRYVFGSLIVFQSKISFIFLP